MTPAAAAEAVLILQRWVHLIAGIMWIGLLYFFVLVNPASWESSIRKRALWSFPS